MMTMMPSRLCRTVLLSCLLTPAFVPEARAQARSRRVSFRTTVEVPDEGVRLPVPQGAQPAGLAPAPVHSYRTPDGRVVEAQAPRDFWYPTQFRGRWDDGRGSRLTLGAASAMFPAQWPRRHVSFTEFAETMAGATAPAGDAEFAEWVQAFAGAALRGAPQDMQPGPRLGRARMFRFEGSAPHRLGVAFSFQQNPFHIDPERWFFVLLEFDGTVDLNTIERDLPRAFLAGISPFARREETTEAASRFQLARSGPAATDRAPAFQASRQRAIDSIRGLRGWWHVATENYVLVSDLPGGRASIVRQIQSDVETLRSSFDALVSARTPIEAVSVIRIFNDGSDYTAYVGPEMAWSGGAWMPGRGELVIRPREWGSVREQREWLLGTVYHESFHQYLHYALGGRPVGIWFNEGHATFFEGAEIRGEQIRFDEVSRYAEAFDRLVSANQLRFGELLSLSHQAFYAGGGSETGRQDNYARSWALIYYLRMHAAQTPDSAHARLAERYVDALARGEDFAQATAAALAGETVESLEEAVAAFWRSNTARRAARRFDPVQGAVAIRP